MGIPILKTSGANANINLTVKIVMHAHHVDCAKYIDLSMRHR
jgi:hypothetical protein